MTTTKLNKKLGFIGCGNMTTAITEAVVKKGLVTFSEITVSGCQAEHLNAWTKKGSLATTENTDIIEYSDIVFLAVKPQIIREALSTVIPSTKTKNKLFVSILAGINIETLKKLLSRFDGARIIRVMPNTPVTVGEGSSVYCPDTTATADDLSTLETILATTGQFRLVKEPMINIATALAGGGPAFIYMVIEAMSDGAVRMGMPRDMATTFAAQTVVGAGRMVLSTGTHPGQLKDNVCSPGGTTITGVHELERAGVRAAFMNAIEMATKRSMELG